jgi:hypothetical protein
LPGSCGAGGRHRSVMHGYFGHSWLRLLTFVSSRLAELSHCRALDARHIKRSVCADWHHVIARTACTPRRNVIGAGPRRNSHVAQVDNGVDISCPEEDRRKCYLGVGGRLRSQRQRLFRAGSRHRRPNDSQTMACHFTVSVHRFAGGSM